MNKIHFLFLLLFLFSVELLQAERTLVRFYSELVELEYDKSILPRQDLKISGPAISRFYGQLERSQYQSLLEDLQSQKEQLQLNDWLYFKLCQQATKQIYKNRKKQEQLIFIWFLLNQSGLDTRITFREQEVFLCAYTNEKIFDSEKDSFK